MVRHYVDNRRPNVTVVVDTNIESYVDPTGFDTAIEIAASLGVSSLLAEQPVAVWLDREAVMGQNRPAGRNDLLDRLTLAERGRRYATSPTPACTRCAASRPRRRSS